MKDAGLTSQGTRTVEELDDVLGKLAAWSHFSDHELRARVKKDKPLSKHSALLQSLLS
jgi:hypothetical protein